MISPYFGPSRLQTHCRYCSLSLSHRFQAGILMHITLLNSVSHHGDVIMGAMASRISSLAFVCTTVYSGADQRQHQSSASQAFVLGIHRGPVNSPHKRPVTRKMSQFDDVIMNLSNTIWINNYIHYKVWDEIIYPFPNFIGGTVEVCGWISNFIPHFTVCVITYLCWVLIKCCTWGFYIGFWGAMSATLKNYTQK